MFFDVGFSEIFLLAVLGLLILGPERLPAVARTLGGWVRRGRKMAAEFQRELEREVDLEEFKQLRQDVEQIAEPLREAAESLDEGNSILNKSLHDAERPIHSDPEDTSPDDTGPGDTGPRDTLEHHEPMPSTESSDSAATAESAATVSSTTSNRPGE